ncbi:unnamed protein product [Symbiodinium necroappetens]|uniref:ShKT domain-containing protein n=1 Tax=Symbiodinium necroappetens TaxID=1628268 RepID=A0A812K9F8_9DINO|nr:unnamed protein product [Symbiodinium necroappetens]
MERQGPLLEHCMDRRLQCEDWAAAGECSFNPKFMFDLCPHTCGVCTQAAAAALEVLVWGDGGEPKVGPSQGRSDGILQAGPEAVVNDGISWNFAAAVVRSDTVLHWCVSPTPRAEMLQGEGLLGECVGQLCAVKRSVLAVSCSARWWSKVPQGYSCRTLQANSVPTFQTTRISLLDLRWNFAGNAPELPQLSRRMKRGAKAMRDLRPLAENTPNQRPLTERTLDAAQDWSVNSTPRGARAGATATCGLELSEESRSHFFGHRTGLDVEAELQRQAVLLKGLLRDVAVMREPLGRASLHLVGVSAPQNDLEQLSADVRELQQAFSCFSRQEEEVERAKLASYESRSLEETRMEEDASASFRELETRFEEHSRMLESRFEDLNPSIKHLESRLEEHKNTLDARFGDEHLSWLEARFEEQRQLLESHGDVQGLRHRMADLELWLRNEVLLQLSANTAEEVIEQASVSVTPLLRQRAEEIAERARPATSPAVGGAVSGAGGQQRPGSPVFLSLALHAERVAEVVHSVLMNAELQVGETCNREGGALIRVNGEIAATHHFSQAVGFLTPVLRLAGTGKAAKLMPGLAPPSKMLADSR